VFEHPPPQRVGADAGQPDEQAYAPPSADCGAQSGAPPSGSQARPHPPQFVAVVNDAHPPSHAVNPSSQVTLHVPLLQEAWAFALPVGHALPHVPQWPGSDVVSTQPASQSVDAVSGQTGTHT
jgi:hypothetical protein